MGIRSTIFSWLQSGATKPRRRMYQGAKFSRLTADWVTGNTSADSEVYGSAQKLRDRARQLCRDNDYARQALRAIEGNVIGQGIPFQTKVQMLRDTRLNHRTCMKKASVLKGRNASMDSNAMKTEKETDSEQYKKSSVL